MLPVNGRDQLTAMSENEKVHQLRHARIRWRQALSATFLRHAIAADRGAVRSQLAK